MKTRFLLIRLGLMLLGVFVSVQAQAFYLLGSNWKEEVLLHDGSRLVVSRSQAQGGGHEIGQESSTSKQSISFTVPGTGQEVTWEDVETEDVGHANFETIMLDISNNTPYLVVIPYYCLAYNKWGRPDPAYVVFKYDEGKWQRILMDELPKEFKESANLTVNPSKRQRDVIAAEMSEKGVVAAETVTRLNKGIANSMYGHFTRTPNGGMGGCPDMISDGHDGWVSRSAFTKSYGQCIQICKISRMTDTYCPCEQLYKGGK